MRILKIAGTYYATQKLAKGGILGRGRTHAEAIADAITKL